MEKVKYFDEEAHNRAKSDITAFCECLNRLYRQIVDAGITDEITDAVAVGLTYGDTGALKKKYMAEVSERLKGCKPAVTRERKTQEEEKFFDEAVGRFIEEMRLEMGRKWSEYFRSFGGAKTLSSVRKNYITIKDGQAFPDAEKLKEGFTEYFTDAEAQAHREANAIFEAMQAYKQKHGYYPLFEDENSPIKWDGYSGKLSYEKRFVSTKLKV